MISINGKDMFPHFICLNRLCFAVLTCTRPNERFSTCGNNCSDSCAAATGPVVCTADCQSGCFCESGYARNTAGNCVLINQCPSKFPEI